MKAKEIGKKFKLEPNDVAFLKLVYSSFAGLDYATAVSEASCESRGAKKRFAVLRATEAKILFGLASEYIRGRLIEKHLIENDPTLFCSYDPSDDNKDGTVVVLTKQEQEEALKKAKESEE